MELRPYYLWRRRLEGGFTMKKYGFRKLKNGWRFKIGGTSGEAFGIKLMYFNKSGFRLHLNFNTNLLIKIFGFNQKVLELRTSR